MCLPPASQASRSVSLYHGDILRRVCFHTLLDEAVDAAEKYFRVQAALRFITNLNFSGCWTVRQARPSKILSTEIAARSYFLSSAGRANAAFERSVEPSIMRAVRPRGA